VVVVEGAFFGVNISVSFCPKGIGDAFVNSGAKLANWFMLIILFERNTGRKLDEADHCDKSS
jgi:hypothetical protein